MTKYPPNSYHLISKAPTLYRHHDFVILYLSNIQMPYLGLSYPSLICSLSVFSGVTEITELNDIYSLLIEVKYTKDNSLSIF